MNDVIRTLSRKDSIQYKAVLSFSRERTGWEWALRANLGERYVMPRCVARYFMGRRNHRHRRRRRRIPTASRYISGCTVNPSGPAVRRLHRGRSPEFREWSSPPAALRPAAFRACSVRECCIVCLSPGCRGTNAVVSLPVGAPLPSPTLRNAHYHRQLPTAPRTLVVRDFFSFLSSFCFPRSRAAYLLPTPDSRLPRSPDG